jgi:hypothetical protein
MNTDTNTITPAGTDNFAHEPVRGPSGSSVASASAPEPGGEGLPGGARTHRRRDRRAADDGDDSAGARRLHDARRDRHARQPTGNGEARPSHARDPAGERRDELSAGGRNKPSWGRELVRGRELKWGASSTMSASTTAGGSGASTGAAMAA